MISLKLPPTAKYRQVGCAPILIAIILVMLIFSCTKDKQPEPIIQTPQTISITLNDNVSEQVLVK